MDSSLFKAGIQMAHDLDAKFGKEKACNNYINNQARQQY